MKYLFILLLAQGCASAILREAEQREMEDARKRMEECRKTPESCDSTIIPED